MNETTASLLLPHIEDDSVWVRFVLAVNKQLTAVLDKNIHWEEHFGLKCGQFQTPLARFRLIRYVECKRMVLSVYDETICDRFRVNLMFVEDSPKSFARQVFRQFHLARQLMDANGITNDDVPGARFSCASLRRPGSPRCDGICYAGDIFIRLVRVEGVPLIEGDLAELCAQLTDTASGMESDRSFECSECGAEQHAYEDDDF